LKASHSAREGLAVPLGSGGAAETRRRGDCATLGPFHGPLTTTGESALRDNDEGFDNGTRSGNPAGGSLQFSDRLIRGETEMKNLVNRFVREEEGQDLIEYGLLIGIITVACITAILAIGPTVAGYFTTLQAALP